MKAYLTKQLDIKRLELIAKHDELGMRASGKFADSLDVEIKEDGSNINAKLTGEAYGFYLSEGRKPGKQPPSKAIEEWIIAKGIATNIDKKISVASLAYLIARKIAREGTGYFQQGGTDLITSVITPDWINEVINNVQTINVNIFVETILKELRQLKNG